MKKGHFKIWGKIFHIHRYLKSFVYGGLDGIITTFAIVAGVAGAALSSNIVLILGFANLIADGFSMSIGDYLSSKAQLEYENKKRFNKKIPLKNAFMTFLAFLVFGFVPLLAYVLSYFFTIDNPFLVSIVLTGIALFFLGVFKFQITGKSWFKSGIETLLIGGVAAGFAYFVGYFVAGLV